MAIERETTWLPKHHASRTEEPRHHSRPGRDSGPALHRHELAGRRLPPPPREMRLPDPDAARVPHPRDRPARRDGQRVRDRQGRVRALRAGGAEGARAGVLLGARDRLIRPGDRGRPRLLRGHVLPRRREERRARLSGAHRGAPENSPGRGRHVHLARQDDADRDPPCTRTGSSSSGSTSRARSTTRPRSTGAPSRRSATRSGRSPSD